MAKKPQRPAAKSTAKPQAKPNLSGHSSKESKASTASEPRLPSKWMPLLTHAGIILVMTLLLSMYFSPALEGKSLQMGDIQQFAGMTDEVRSYREQTGNEAYWTNSMFSGMPTYHIGLNYPSNLINKVRRAYFDLLPSPIPFILLLFLGCYLLLNVLELKPWLSALGAMAFAFSSYFFVILEAGHTSKSSALGFMAPVIAGVLLTYRGRYVLGGALTALALAFELASNHFQITYYLGITLILLGLAYLVDAIIKRTLPQFFTASAILLLAAALGIGPNLGLLWTTSEYAQETIRGKSELAAPEGESAASGSGLDKEYALQWSYGRGETLTLLIANFNGGATAPIDQNSAAFDELRKTYGQQLNQIYPALRTYWGDQPFTSGPVYAGAIICFLFLLGAFLVDGPIKWWLVAATLLSILLSWGRHLEWFTDIFFYNVPYYNKFRAVAMTLVIAEFTLPVLGVLGLHRIFNRETFGLDNKRIMNALKISAGIMGGLALLFVVAGSSILDFTGAGDVYLEQNPDLLDLLKDHRKTMLQGDALRSALLIAASALAIWLYLRNNIKETALVAIIGVLTLGDLWTVNQRYLSKENFSRKKVYDAPTPSQVDQFILQDKDPHFRVLNFNGGNISNTFNNAAGTHFHKQVGGYHAAKLRRYQDLIDRHLIPEMTGFIEALRQKANDSSIQAALQNLPVTSMLNAKYYIISPESRPIENPYAMGNAWMVGDIKMVEGANDAIKALGEVDVRTTAVIENSFASQLEGLNPVQDSMSSIQLLSYSPNELSYESNSTVESLALFSEIYYNAEKGWKAYIDNTETPHLRANYVLRGLRIPAGKHKITFRMEPKSYLLGEKIALASSILLLLAFAAGIFVEYRKKRPAANPLSTGESA